MSDFKSATDTDVNAVHVRNQAAGTISSTGTIKFVNPKAYILQTLRVALQLSTGLFTGGTDEQGQEMQDEQWIEVRKQGDVTWVPIGGPYGLDDTGAEEGTNFLALPNLGVGASVTIEYRVNIPGAAATARITTGRFIVSWNDALSSGVP